jgi:hypothetical protein
MPPVVILKFRDLKFLNTNIISVIIAKTNSPKNNIVKKR